MCVRIIALILTITLSNIALADDLDDFIDNLYNTQQGQGDTKLNVDIDREAKIANCISKYIKDQSRGSKSVKETLYDLNHNFDRITSRIHGKKAVGDNVPYDEKLNTLAKAQCNEYFEMKVLK
jgi:hypothetical protein